VKISVMSGDITVKAGTGRDVVVAVSGDDNRERERQRQRERDRDRDRDDQNNTSGLRRLTQPAGVNIEEDNNTITISNSVMSRSSDVTVQVPAATNLQIRSINGAEVNVEGVNGSIEVNSTNGSIRLTDVGGTVVAHATNGKVTATLKQLAAGKPVSFTSFNGNVDVTLPPSAKASLKLRSDRGDVYTDFDVQATPAPRVQVNPQADDRRRRNDPKDKDKDTAKYRVEMDRSIYGAINGGGPDVELRTFNGNVYLRKGK
jgi:DUF4097 and DUF4098 domain-containing protein YvlB